MYTYIPISPPSCISLPPRLSHPSRWSQSTKLISLCYGCFPLAIYFTFGSVYMSMPLSYFVPPSPSPSPCLQVHSLHLCLHSCVALRFIRTILFFYFFLDSIICVSIQYLFFSFWLTSLCMKDSRSIHLTTNNSISFFSWLSNIPLYICATSSLSIHLSVDT